MEIVRHNIHVLPDTSRLSDLREQLSRFCETKEVPSKTTRRMVLAIDEALSNIIEHAALKDSGQLITLGIEITSSQIVVEISDWGLPFDPSPHGMDPEMARFPRRGFGLYLIHLIVDRIDYTRTSDGQNVLTLTKTIQADDVGKHEKGVLCPA